MQRRPRGSQEIWEGAPGLAGQPWFFADLSCKVGQCPGIGLCIVLAQRPVPVDRTVQTAATAVSAAIFGLHAPLDFVLYSGEPEEPVVCAA